MFKKYTTTLLFMMVIGLAGCSSTDEAINDLIKEGGDNKQEVVASDENEIEREKSEASPNTKDKISQTVKGSDASQATIHPDEIQDIMEKTVRDIHTLMVKEQENHDWFMLEEEDPGAFSSELRRIKQPLSNLIADDYMDEEAQELLEAYTCYCDNYFLFTEHDTHAGLTVTKQTDNVFEASTITLDDGFYGSGWTNNWRFEKEQGKWKLADYDYIFAEEKPLDVTFKQIEHAFFNPETGKPEDVTFIEYLNVGDTCHMVIQRMNGDYEIYNTETGAMNYTAMEQYDDNK